VSQTGRNDNGETVTTVNNDDTQVPRTNANDGQIIEEL
jgi:hypothetical protein